VNECKPLGSGSASADAGEGGGAIGSGDGGGRGLHQSDKTSHIDTEDDHIDAVISHVISPHPISTSRMTISIW